MGLLLMVEGGLFDDECFESVSPYPAGQGRAEPGLGGAFGVEGLASPVAACDRLLEEALLPGLSEEAQVEGQVPDQGQVGAPIQVGGEESCPGGLGGFGRLLLRPVASERVWVHGLATAADRPFASTPNVLWPPLVPAPLPSPGTPRPAPPSGFHPGKAPGTLSPARS